MRAIRHAWVAAVLKPNRSIRANTSLTGCSTAQQKASQGATSPSRAESQDPVDLKTILDVEVLTREAQVFIPNACLSVCPKCSPSQELHSMPDSHTPPAPSATLCVAV